MCGLVVHVYVCACVHMCTGEVVAVAVKECVMGVGGEQGCHLNTQPID